MSKFSQIKNASDFSSWRLWIFIGIFGLLGATAYLALAAGRPTGEPTGKASHANDKSTKNTTAGTTATNPAKSTNHSAASGSNPTGRDTTPPTLSIGGLSGGATVSGKVRINVSASDNSGIITKTELYLDGSFLAQNTTSPYGYTWDTTTTTNAAHSLTIQAFDPSGNATGKIIYVSVLNTSDTSGPAISVLSPGSGANVSGSVTIRATASDVSGVANLNISIDGTVVAVCSESTACTYIWNTAPAAKGTHTLQITATDSAAVPNTSQKILQVTKS